MKRRWPWIVFGGVLLLGSALAMTPPPDRFATFSNVGRPIRADDLDRIKRTAVKMDSTVEGMGSLEALNGILGYRRWRVRAWALPMSVHEARRRLASCDLPSRPILSENARAGYPKSGADYRSWLYLSATKDVGAELMESPLLPKEYGCAVLVAETDVQQKPWERIVWRLKRRLGL